MGSCQISASAGKAEGLESHGLQRTVACEDHEVGPGNVLAILLLDGPQQPACLVEVRIVRPTVEGREALATRSCAATPVAGAVGSGTEPSHPDEKPSIVTVVRRPPVLRIGHTILD